MNDTSREIINTIFQAVLVSYLLLLLLEELKNGFVSKYFNLNYALVLVVFFGILTVFFPYEREKREVIPLDYFFVVFLGIIGGLIILYKTKQLKWLSYVISIVGGLLIILLGILVLEEDSK